MAENTGKGHRTGAVSDRTQVKNPQTDQHVKRNRDPDSAHNGEFMDVKQDGTRCNGVAEERTNAARTGLDRESGIASVSALSTGCPSRATSQRGSRR